MKSGRHSLTALQLNVSEKGFILKNFQGYLSSKIEEVNLGKLDEKEKIYG